MRPFFIHLRLHYQLLILSAPFLCGGLLAESVAWPRFLGQWLNVQILLFGGATAYNSFWDRDEGPIGGLKTPPRMTAWMRPAALALQALGLLLATMAGWRFTALYGVAALCFWLYSTPLARWKGRPLLSLVAIGVSTGVCALLMGKLAATATPLTAIDGVASAGVGLTLLSLYPASQLYQLRDDRQRGDRTFALAYGVHGVRRAFALFYSLGIALLGVAFHLAVGARMAALFTVAGVLIGVASGRRLRTLQGTPAEYAPIMHLKYAMSAAFVLFVGAALAYRAAGGHL